MKVVILAGGLPSTVMEEDEKIPKPMAEIGGRPILWHIMKQYAHYGFQDFIICTGYKGELIKRYFMDYYIYQSDITIDLQKNEVEIHHKKTEDWNVSVVDTGKDTGIVERIARVREYIGDETFIVTYGDCVSNIDIAQMVAYHKKYGKMATVAVAHPTGRNEVVSIGRDDDLLFQDENMVEDVWVNACSMIYEPNVLELMDKNKTSVEKELFTMLSMQKEIVTYKHAEFWSPMETRRDRSVLEQMWKCGQAPWRVWESD